MLEAPQGGLPVIDPRSLPLLAFIYRAETGRTGAAAHETIIGHHEDQLPWPLTDYTLGELLEAQKAWSKKWKSSAAGAPQIIRSTLLDLCGRLDLKAEQKFTPELPDQLAYQLLVQRGFAEFIAGRLALKSFALRLSMEWALLPLLYDTQGADNPREARPELL
jgi:hypothetical protein